MGNTHATNATNSQNQANNNVNNNVNIPNQTKAEKLLEQKIYIWIDKDINKTFFQESYYNPLFNQQRPCLKFDDVNEAIEHLKKLINKLEEVIIIINGSFFQKFCKEYNDNISEIKIYPNITIFCIRKKEFISNLKINNNFLDNHLLNKEQIFNEFNDLKNFINGKKEEKEVEELTFEEIENNREIIIPSFYSYLIQDVTETEIFFYNKNMLSIYKDKDKNKEEKIKSIIRHLNEGNVNSKEIMSRHWLFIYTIESDFYKELNKSLRKKIIIIFYIIHLLKCVMKE